MHFKKWSAAVLTLPLFPLYAAEDVNELSPVVVTASRVAETADETLASVTVITRDEIEQRQVNSMGELLQGVPGLTLSNNGGLGKATSVFLRGTESDHVLVLIDGVKVGSATLGTTAFQDIPVEQIERVEIVRGPRSSLYGSEAIGGVIQIFTRRGGGDLRPFFSVGGGSYDTYSASAGVSGGGENSWFNLTVSGIDSGGFNSCDGSFSGGCFTIEPDKDGYRNLSGSLSAGYRFNNGAEAELQWLLVDSDNEFDGSFVNETEAAQQVLSGKFSYAPTEIWDLTLQAGFSEDKADNFKDGDFQSRFDTERVSASLQNDIYLDDSQLVVLGIDYRDDQVDGTVDYEESSRYNTAGFAQYQGQFGANEIQASLRYDDNEQFGDYTTGSAAWGYQLSDALRFWTSYGTAFKAPTFNELYFPDFGNPDLDPEKSRSIEASLNGAYDWGRWSLNLYQIRVDDLISFNAATRAPENIGEARITGLEAVYAHQLMGWDLQGTLTLLDPENRSGGVNQGNQLPRRPESAFRLAVDRNFDRYSVGATVYAQGSSYDDLANTRRLGGYATLDLRGTYQFAKDWRVEAKLANVLDKQYETAAYFNQPGFNAFVTLRYQP